ncbi:site-specific DNA-methyltransferase [Desulfovulcanus sp.]
MKRKKRRTSNLEPRTKKDSLIQLTWPGKSSETASQVRDDSRKLSWQVRERFFPARNFPSWVSLTPKSNNNETSASPWINKLFWGENFLVLQTLADKFVGKIDLIYIDPPFATGINFSFQRPIGEKTYRDKHYQIVDLAYRDCWDKGLPSYLSMIQERLRLMYNLLSDRGSLYVHVDYRVSAYLRLILDEIFGPENFINEIIWFYKTGGMPEKLGFGRKHDNILFYVKDRTKAIWNPQKEKSYLMHKYGFANIEIFKDERGEYTLVNCRDVFDISALRGNQPERVDYPTQKPEALLERIIKASTNPGDLVADFFCGSGTTLCVAEKLGRRWLGSDLGRWAVHVTKKRLLQVKGCAPFEVLDFGRLERSCWQKNKLAGKSTLRFILACLGIEEFEDNSQIISSFPLGGNLILVPIKSSALDKLHGRTKRPRTSDKTMNPNVEPIYVAAPHETMFFNKVKQLVDVCGKVGKRVLHILAWEWAGDVFLGRDYAGKKKVDLYLRTIPREIMEDAALKNKDTHFYELPVINVRVVKKSDKSIELELKDFFYPHAELIPEEIKTKIEKWSDYIDYWAVSLDYKQDVFLPSWVGFRTRNERRLPLITQPLTFNDTHGGRVRVKVVDIFGQETEFFLSEI